MILHAISIRQFWSGLVVCGLKPIENRSWKLPHKYWGKPVLIHAGLRVDPAIGYRRQDAARQAVEAGWDGDEVRRRMDGAAQIWGRGWKDAVGGVVGVAIFDGCDSLSTSPWAMPGQVHWHVRVARPLEFYECPGRLGVFDIDYPFDVPEVIRGI